MADASELSQRRAWLVLDQLRLEQKREHGWQTRVAELLKVHQSTVNKAYSEQRGMGRRLLEAMIDYGINPAFFHDAALGDGPRFRDHMETRVEREYPHDAAILAFAAEREAEGRPIPASVIERLRRDVNAWDGKLTHDHLVMLLPIARDRVEQLEAGAPPPEPPPVPEGRRRVPPGRPRR